MPRIDSGLGALASRIGVPSGLDISDGAALSYMALLDRVLEDRHITADEVGALADVAAEWGISADAATRLHLAYLNALWRLVRNDGVVTDAERADVEMVAELLGVPLAPLDDAVEVASRVLGAPAEARRHAAEQPQALAAHRRRRYRVSISVLLPHLEGIAFAAFAPGNDRSDPRVAIRMAGLDYEELTSDGLLDAITVLYAGGQDFAATATGSLFNRHLILHGRRVDFATEVHSTKVLMAFDLLAQVVRMAHERRVRPALESG